MSHGVVALSFEDPFTMDDWIEQWNATQAANCRGQALVMKRGGYRGSLVPDVQVRPPRAAPAWSVPSGLPQAAGPRRDPWLNPWAIRRAGGRLGSSTPGWPRKKAPEDRSLKFQKDISESSPSWTAWPMPSPALRALALHCASQGINVSKCDVPARRPVCAHWRRGFGPMRCPAFEHAIVTNAD
jgi:hypothetical protein